VVSVAPHTDEHALQRLFYETNIPEGAAYI
jgi:hypothetical protein